MQFMTKMMTKAYGVSGFSINFGGFQILAPVGFDCILKMVWDYMTTRQIPN